MKRKVLLAVSVASMVLQFNLPNIRILLDMGCEVHVACNFKKGNTCAKRQVMELLQLLQNLHVKCHQWDCPRKTVSLRSCVKAYHQIYKLMEQHKFAWVHCQSPVGGVLARIAGHSLRIRLLYTAHGFHFYKGAPWKNWLLYYPVEKLLAHWTDVLITVNQEDFKLAKRSLKAGKICYIPGVGIDIPASDPSIGETMRQRFRKKYRIPEDAAILLSVGELSKRKNHIAVIRALANMKETNVYYLICGQGKLKRRLKIQAQVLGIAGRVRLLGYREQMEPFYKNADIFVFPSFQEGLPMALLEAMAAGMACVVSDIRGNRELISESGGIRFSYKKRMHSGRMELADAIETLLTDEIRRRNCGSYNRQKVKNFSLDKVNGRMKQIYASQRNRR